MVELRGITDKSSEKCKRKKISQTFFYARKVYKDNCDPFFLVCLIIFSYFVKQFCKTV